MHLPPRSCEPVSPLRCCSIHQQWMDGPINSPAALNVHLPPAALPLGLVSCKIMRTVRVLSEPFVSIQPRNLGPRREKINYLLITRYVAACSCAKKPLGTFFFCFLTSGGDMREVGHLFDPLELSDII